MDRHNSRINWKILCFFGIIAIYLVLRIPFLGKEYAPEEVAWIQGGHGMAATGFPLVYSGENVKVVWARWKGPLFPVLMGIAFKIFGEREVVARSLPLLFGLGQILIIYLLCRRLFAGDRGAKIGMLAMLIIAINPLSIQGSVQIDIDGSLVAFFSLLTLYFTWSTLQKNPKRKDFFYLLLGSMGAFLVRFDVTLMMFFSIVLFATLQKKYRLALKLALTFLLAIILAVGIFAIYTASVGQFARTLDPFINLFGQLSGTFLAKLGLLPNGQTFTTTTVQPPTTRLYDVFPGAKNKWFAAPLVTIFPTLALSTVLFVWITVPLAILIVLWLLAAIWDKKYKLPEVLFISLPALVISTAFIILAPSFSFPRYFQTPLTLFAIALSYMALEQLEVLAPRAIWKIFTVIGAVLLVILIFTPAKIFLLDDRVRSSPVFAGGVLGATLAASLIIFFLIKNNSQRFARVTCALLAAYLTFAGIIMKKDLARPYSLNAYYGNYGFRDAGMFLKNNAPNGSIVVAVDTIGYYYGKPYYDVGGFNEKTDPHPDFIAVYRVPPARFANIVEGYRKIAAFGTVEIYSTKL